MSGHRLNLEGAGAEEDQTKTESQIKVKILKILKNERMVSLGGNFKAKRKKSAS